MSKKKEEKKEEVQTERSAKAPDIRWPGSDGSQLAGWIGARRIRFVASRRTENGWERMGPYDVSLQYLFSELVRNRESRAVLRQLYEDYRELLEKEETEEEQ